MTLSSIIPRLSSSQRYRNGFLINSGSVSSISSDRFRFFIIIIYNYIMLNNGKLGLIKLCPRKH